MKITETQTLVVYALLKEIETSIEANDDVASHQLTKAALSVMTGLSV